MNGTTETRTSARESELAGVLGDVAAGLHGVSMPSDVVEEELRAISDEQGVSMEVLILQGRLELQVGTGPGSEVVLRTIDFDPGWNLRRIADLQGVVSRLRGNGMATNADLLDARREIAEIVGRPSTFSAVPMALAYAGYGAAVAARVGGAWREVAASVVVGFVAGVVHSGATRSRQMDLWQSFSGAFCGMLTALLLRLALPPFDETRAVYGGISLLVPSMVVTIGTQEIVHEALESGALRLTYGLLRLMTLGFGIAAAMQRRTALFASARPEVVPVPLSSCRSVSCCWWRRPASRSLSACRDAGRTRPGSPRACSSRSAFRRLPR